MIAYLTWNPSPYMFHFNLPLLDRPVLWYGFFFALGFFLGYLVLSRLIHRYDKSLSKAERRKFCEQLTFYVIVGAIIGARLGDVIFYQNWADIARHPMSIISVWEGGLASHGGAVGMLIALWIFSRIKKIPFWTVADFIVIPSAIGAACIRIGNFFNQEILGIPTTLPWGIIFLHPADGGPIVPRHPAQLYEAIWYLCVFVILLVYWKKHPPFKPKGKLTGLFLLLVFGFRFLIEFIKVEQSTHHIEYLTMGQWLSIPFFILGLYLFLRRK